MTLAEAKALLHGMQEVVVTEQIAECLITSRPARTAARTGLGKDNIPSRIEPRSGNSTCQGCAICSAVSGRESEHLLD